MSNAISWFEIYVDDMARAVEFYQAVFGVQLEKLGDPTDSGMEMMTFPADMEKYGASGALVKMDGFSAGTGGTLVYFGCDNCAVEEARADAAGGKVVKPKMSIGEYGFISLINDTEGNMIGLHSMG